MSSNPVIGIIGGSGLYQLEGLRLLEEIVLDTPYGNPSDKIVSGEIGDCRVYFLPRHGKNHRLLPSEVPYRANIYALKKLGASWCIGVTAVGSLQEELKPGDIAVPDQLIDRTRQRANTFFGEGVVAHISFADPYCQVLRECLIDQARQLSASSRQFKVHDRATYVCMEGPAFSTRAESHLYRSWNAQLIGMTALPEAKLAREAEIAYANLAFVTDYDCWKEDEGPVDVQTVMKTIHQNSGNARQVLSAVVKKLAATQPSDAARNALSGAFMSSLKDLSEERRNALEPIIGRYL